MKTKKQKLPKCNGRPQLWSRRDFKCLRIIMPDGEVLWTPIELPGFYDEGEFNGRGCTGDKTQEKAVKNIINYDIKVLGCSRPEFLGYL